MPTNQIKQFAAGGGANALTPAAYAALTTLLSNGFQSGKADSIKFNTVLRQSSFIATMIAQFICDKALVDVNDDGDLATLKTSFVDAINSLIDDAIEDEATLRIDGDAAVHEYARQLDIARAIDTQNKLNLEAYIRDLQDQQEANARYTRDENLQYQIDGLSNGAILRTGTVAGVTQGSLISFASGFPNACTGVVVSPINRSAYIATGGAMTIGGYNCNATGFNLTMHDNNANPVTSDISYIAFGN